MVGQEVLKFYDLIVALDDLEGVDRIRISSIEPNLLSNDIIDFVASSKKFMPHFHIPLQTGVDRLLHAMRRKYDTALYRSQGRAHKGGHSECLYWGRCYRRFSGRDGG